MIVSTLPSQPAVAPVLSTPETHIFEDPTPAIEPALPRLDDEQLLVTYEIERTVEEIVEGRWKKIALQFPDTMLADAPRVYEGLQKGLKRKRGATRGFSTQEGIAVQVEGSYSATEQEIADRLARTDLENGGALQRGEPDKEEKLFILADTSYGACCVDEIAAEHADADVVVHYGRSCLSPTTRLPVIYVFTTQPLHLEHVVTVFKDAYSDLNKKIILMADIPYASHIPDLAKLLEQQGYTNIFSTALIHNPASPLPNRTVPREAVEDATKLQNYQVFHISDPPTALLLTLSSRVSAMYIYPTTGHSSSQPTKAALVSTTKAILRRRYAIITSLTTTGILGILINTLSVKNYMHIHSHVQKAIAAAGKKSYTFVVGKVNAAKIANFSEIGGWVVIGCWESSLVENAEFYRPVITPWELELALQEDAKRIWTGEWKSDFQSVLDADKSNPGKYQDVTSDMELVEHENATNNGEFDGEEESEPPEFDLRTGRYVSHSRPMRVTTPKNVQLERTPTSSKSLVKRSNGDVIEIGAVASPGAQFLRENRTWQGLGSDFEVRYQQDEQARAGAQVEQGRSGVARGYTIGERGSKT